MSELTSAVTDKESWSFLICPFNKFLFPTQRERGIPVSLALQCAMPRLSETILGDGEAFKNLLYRF